MTMPVALVGRLRLPVICSPLFIISNPDLVIAQCKAGVVGSFPSLNARPASVLDEWLHRITEELAAWNRDHPDAPAAPFAVNQIVHRSNDRLDRDMELCAKYRVPIVITSLGARADVNEAVHRWGGITLHDVIDDRFARKAIEKGADGLIPVAAGAGGHAGTLSPFALLQEVRSWFEGPVALSGAIAHGRSILAAQAAGADLAYVGSLFIATEEANADPAHKQMIVDSAARDIVYSNLFTGVHGNYLGPSITRAGLDPTNLPQSDPSAMDFGSGGNTVAKAWRDVWGCGQGIGTVGTVEPVAVVVERLAREYGAAKLSVDARFVLQPAIPHILSGERVRTHADIIARAKRAAEGLRALGVGPGDSVALVLRNDFAFFEASHAAGLVGAFAVPINWHSTADEAGYIVRDCGAKLVIVHGDLFEQIRAGLPDDVTVLIVRTPPELLGTYGATPLPRLPDGAREWDEWLQSFPPIGVVAPSAPLAVIYTSGTTGKPKGVRREPTSGDIAMRTAAVGYGLATAEHRVVLMNGPMYHSAPNGYARIAFATGADFVLQPRFDAEEMLQLIERHQVTHMHMVPTMFVRLLRLPDEVRGRYDLSSLRHVVHGAAPCPPGIKRQMIEWWGPVIHEYYGATEMGLVAAHSAEEAMVRPGTVGRPLPEVEIRILDDGGDVLSAGVIGHVYVRPSTAAFTYIGREQERAEIESDGFVTVGGVGYLDGEGYLFLCDRARDMIISGGVNIYPAEIEAALHAIDGVQDCAVFGIPDAESGEAVCAHVQPVAGVDLDPEALRKQLGRTLSRFKVPRSLEIVGDLPREDSGKIFKRRIREQYWSSASEPAPIP